MRADADLDVLETILGYSFRDRDILHRALTHKSRLSELGAAVGKLPADNEQLEFLGDSILGFLVSEALVERFPLFPEGRLSKLKAHLVSSSHLYDVAKRLDLGAYLILGRGEEMSGGRAKKALLANVVEALIAAVYLDSGIAEVRRFVSANIMGSAESLEGAEDSAVTDFKTALQEVAQSLKLSQPKYAVVKESGPEHSKTFTVEARIGRRWTAQADGHSKKSASQQAARQVLKQVLEESGSGS